MGTPSDSDTLPSLDPKSLVYGLKYSPSSKEFIACSVFEGSMIVANAASGCIVMREMDEESGWKVLCYALCIVAVVSGLVVLILGEDTSREADLTNPPSAATDNGDVDVLSRKKPQANQHAPAARSSGSLDSGLLSPRRVHLTLSVSSTTSHLRGSGNGSSGGVAGSSSEIGYHTPLSSWQVAETMSGEISLPSPVLYPSRGVMLLEIMKRSRSGADSRPRLCHATSDDLHLGTYGCTASTVYGARGTEAAAGIGSGQRGHWSPQLTPTAEMRQSQERRSANGPKPVFLSVPLQHAAAAAGDGGAGPADGSESGISPRANYGKQQQAPPPTPPETHSQLLLPPRQEQQAEEPHEKDKSGPAVGTAGKRLDGDWDTIDAASP